MLHRPQGRDIDQLGVIGARCAIEQGIQVLGLQDLALGQRKARSHGRFPQGLQLFWGWFFVHPEQQRRALFDQGLGGGHICEDHEFLNQLMRVQPVTKGHRGDLTIVVQHNFAFRQVQIQRLAPGTGLFQRCVGGIKRFDHRLQKALGALRHLAIHGVLDLGVMQRGSRSHQPAHKTVRDLVALGIDLHAHCQTGARYALVQRAQIARQTVRQHWHHAVREIRGIAAFARLAVQLAAGFDIGGNISDGDPDDMATGVLRIGIRFGVAGVIVVAGIGRVDGDQRHVTQIFAPR